MVNSGNQLVSDSHGLLQDWCEIPQHWFIYQKSNSVNHGVNDGVINGSHVHRVVNRLRVNNRLKIRFLQEPISLALEVDSNIDNNTYMNINSDTSEHVKYW